MVRCTERNFKCNDHQPYLERNRELSVGIGESLGDFCERNQYHVGFLLHRTRIKLLKSVSQRGMRVRGKQYWLETKKMYKINE